MNFIEELYYGNISPVEKGYDANSCYASFVRVIANNEGKLLDYLNSLPEAKEEQRLFSQLVEAQDEVLRFSEMNRFIEGFQLGARLMLDSLVLPQQSAIRDIT
ncbi:MAG: hypothetical protein BGN88_02020 [Clostridiales bacterium 43-6]|nr:MAG: hypothetical protein BGN88_02020 [Clostridiales bacterium 43-6]